MILIILIYNGCRSPEFQSHWTEQLIMIDGADNDWNDVPLHQIEAWNSSLRICNDDSYFYMLLNFEDPFLAMTVGSGGISLQFARHKEEDLYFELRYTGSDTLGSAPQPRDSFWELLNSDQKRRFLTQQAKNKNMITVIKNSRSEKMHSDGTKDLAAARIQRRGFKGYELKIPIQGEYAVGAVLGGSFHVGIRLGAQKQPGEVWGMMRPGGMRGDRGMMGGSAGDRFGNSMPGELSTPDREVWFKVTLANQNYVKSL
jgi:hypothetical protein